MAGKPQVTILATGGTIAGQAAASADATQYAVGVLDVDTLLRSVPDMAKYARVRGFQVASIGSEDMTEEVWLRLAAEVVKAAAKASAGGIVVLHGTDTMEETAYLLNLLVKTDVPVVFTGAMRPANAVGADGPPNILAAVAVAAHPESRGRGVMLVMNDRILAARDAVKCDCLNVDAFRAPSAGPIGIMVGGIPRFQHEVLSPHTAASEFAVATARELPRELPRVEILYGHAGQREDTARAILDLPGLKGMVYAGVGAGNVHAAAKPLVAAAAKRGVAVVCSSRIAGGVVPLKHDEGKECGFVYSGSLNPQKARVLLQIALLQKRSRADLQRIFLSY